VAVQRFIGLGGYVRLNAHAFPVGLADRIAGPHERHAGHDAVIDANAADGVRAAAGFLADDGRALQVLEVVAELLGP
jgi:hypothetical protein